MRIEANNPDPQSVATEQTTKKSPAAVTNQLESTFSSDQTTLSEDSVSLSALATQALNQPEVRQNLVNSLRESVNNGLYRLDPSTIAGAIVGE